MKWRRKKKLIFQLEVTANPLKSQGQNNSTCLCQTDGEGHRLVMIGRVQEWDLRNERMRRNQAAGMGSVAEL